LLLKPHGAKKDRFTRAIDFVLGWFFKLFNRFFGRASGGYGKLVTHTLRSSAIAVVVYAGLVGSPFSASRACPQDLFPHRIRDISCRSRSCRMARRSIAPKM